jgi:hypothetical protein
MRKSMKKALKKANPNAWAIQKDLTELRNTKEMGGQS